MNDVLSATNSDQTMRTTIDIHTTEPAVNAAAVGQSERGLALGWTPSPNDRALTGRRLR
jgi:hypothetical protein